MDMKFFFHFFSRTFQRFQHEPEASENRLVQFGSHELDGQIQRSGKRDGLPGIFPGFFLLQKKQR